MKKLPAMFRPPLIGLDISTEAVRMVELSGGRGQLSVSWADVEPCTKAEVGAGSVSSTDNVTGALQRLLQRARSRHKSVASALSASSVIVKVISLPTGMHEDAIEGQIRFEGQQYIPYPMDQVNFDFSILGADKDRSGYQQVLLVASKKEIIEDHLAIIEAAGLKAKFLEVRQFSLWNLYNHIHPQAASERSTIALIEIGHTSFEIYVFESGTPIYSREHQFGISRLLERIARNFGLTMEDAGRMQRFGGLPESYETEVLQPFVEDLAGELMRALDFFQTSMSDISVQRVVVFGSGASLPGIASNMPGIQVENPDPFRDMSLAPGVNQRLIHQEGSSLAVACGLALRRFTA
ncbi:type IV pilus assembly protein PilM [Candidatus Igneacidithiobacillus taiwanensis]|uniref:type IV pilus assembly protein PilM n=1 Tax=Candidatus Igneacidithiobacillus taiwanensis TaxID=1945924 RepID=UPI00289FE08C|nr:type IV pilus assembly protein PilM [Candidatus Igneacidithiobacillus taiwanensis]MCE5359474.1 type IV pilus assembly protein PilM [Acidithiobacillus sp.]